MLDQLRAFLGDALSSQLGIAGERSFLGNTLNDYILAFIIFVLAIAIFKLVQWLVLRQLDRIAQRTRTDLDDTFVKMANSAKPPFYIFLAFWLSLQFLAITGIADKLFTGILIIWAVYQVVIAAGIFIEDLLFKRFTSDGDPTTQSALKILTNLAKGAIWGLGIILMLSNLGVDVTSLVAGVGIGGIAIAFALQGILSDLFASFSIYFDKPFEVGDFIIVGSTLGVVKHIGIKSTRIQSLWGEEIVVSNQELTTARIQNYKKMEERRVQFGFRIRLDTPYEKLVEVSNWIREAVERQEHIRFDRAHFKAFGESSLEFEVVYYVLSPDYNQYMDIQQAINFALVERLRREGVYLAYPTQLVYEYQLGRRGEAEEVWNENPYLSNETSLK
jgi:small-conductance mechanosensitive channel